MPDPSQDDKVVYADFAGATVDRTYTNTNVSFGGGRGGGPVEPSVPIKDYIDARDEAIETRLSTQLASLPTAKDMRTTVWGAAGVVLGLALAALAFGGDRFDSGMSAADVLDKAQANQKSVDAAQDKKLDTINAKIDLLIERTASKK